MYILLLQDLTRNYHINLFLNDFNEIVVFLTSVQSKSCTHERRDAELHQASADKTLCTRVRNNIFPTRNPRLNLFRKININSSSVFNLERTARQFRECHFLPLRNHVS